MKHIIVCLVCQCIYLYPPLCTNKINRMAIKAFALCYHLTNMLSRVYYDSMYTLPQYTKSKVNRLIPSPVRKALGAKPGDDLLWEISLDANALIYLIENHPDFSPKISPIFNQIFQNQLQSITSIITVTEVQTC